MFSRPVSILRDCIRRNILLLKSVRYYGGIFRATQLYFVERNAPHYSSSTWVKDGHISYSARCYLFDVKSEKRDVDWLDYNHYLCKTCLFWTRSDNRQASIYERETPTAVARLKLQVAFFPRIITPAPFFRFNGRRIQVLIATDRCKCVFISSLLFSRSGDW